MIIHAKNVDRALSRAPAPGSLLRGSADAAATRMRNRAPDRRLCDDDASLMAASLAKLGTHAGEVSVAEIYRACGAAREQLQVIER